MFDVGGGELILIVLVILLLFGPKSLPDLARSVGRGMRQVRKAQEDLTQQIRDISADVERPVTQIRSEIDQAITARPATSTTPRNDSSRPPSDLPSDPSSER